MQKGKFIVIEGCDGSGKTTVIEKLREEFKDNPEYVFIKAPGSTALGEVIRKILKNKKYSDICPKTWLYLFMSTMIELVEKEIKPNLEQGKTIICDRFAMSTWVYQNAMDKSLASLIETLVSDLTKHVKVDKTIYLDVDLDIIKSRTKLRSSKEDNDFIDEAKDTFFKDILTWYTLCILGATFPKELIGKVSKIDAKQSFEDVFKQVKQSLL